MAALSHDTDDGDVVTGELVEEGKKQVELGVPMAIMGVMSFLLSSVCLAFVGRLGAVYLAAAAMATSSANTFGYAILDGLASGMETEGGQAHGAGQEKLLGVVLQRGVLILLIACVPVSITFSLGASRMLLFLGKDPEIVHLASQYLLRLIPGLFATACLSPLQKFLQVQGVMVPLAVSQCTVLLLSFPANYLCTFVPGWGYLGAAAAYSTAAFLNLGFLCLYLLRIDSTGVVKRAWPGWTSAPFRDWSPFLALALPAMAMNCLEWWFFEALVLMSGLLPRPEVTFSAMNITYQTCGLCYVVFLCQGIAASVRVSNELGAGMARRERTAAVAAVVNTLLTACVFAGILLLFRHQWASIFTGSGRRSNSGVQDVVAMVALVMPLLALSQLGFSVSGALSGVMRGSGQQLAGSVVNGLGLWAVALPTSIYLAFRLHYGLSGLWWGVIAGVSLQALMNLAIVWRTDRAVKADNASHRFVELATTEFI